MFPLAYSRFLQVSWTESSLSLPLPYLSLRKALYTCVGVIRHCTFVKQSFSENLLASHLASVDAKRMEQMYEDSCLFRPMLLHTMYVTNPQSSSVHRTISSLAPTIFLDFSGLGQLPFTALVRIRLYDSCIRIFVS